MLIPSRAKRHWRFLSREVAQSNLGHTIITLCVKNRLETEGRRPRKVEARGSVWRLL